MIVLLKRHTSVAVLVVAPFGLTASPYASCCDDDNDFINWWQVREFTTSFVRFWDYGIYVCISVYLSVRMSIYTTTYCHSHKRDFTWLFRYSSNTYIYIFFFAQHIWDFHLMLSHVRLTFQVIMDDKMYVCLCVFSPSFQLIWLFALT